MLWWLLKLLRRTHTPMVEVGFSFGENSRHAAGELEGRAGRQRNARHSRLFH
jgi:hypothetical protein